MRKCMIKTCRRPLPPKKKSDRFQEKGLCGLECYIEYFKANKQEIARDAHRRTQKAHKQRKREALGKDLKHQKRLTIEAAQRLARRLDRGRPCISCGRPDDGSVQFCGSHFSSKGAHPETAIDLRVIHGACNQYCNLQLSGNITGNKHTHGYRQGIAMRYGDYFVEWLERAHAIKKYTAEQYQAIRKTYNAEIRRLDKGRFPSMEWRSLQYDVLDICVSSQNADNVSVS